MTIIEDSRQQAGKHELKHEHFADMGVNLVRNALPVGDYCLPPTVSVDTKANMDEIAAGDDAKRRQMDWNSNKWMSKDRCRLSSKPHKSRRNAR